MEIKKIYESDIENKGLDYIRTLDIFEIWGNHYFPYPSILSSIENEYNTKTEYYGSSDQGSTKTIFTRRESEKVLKEQMQNKINIFANNNGIIIKDWSFKK